MRSNIIQVISEWFIIIDNTNTTNWSSSNLKGISKRMMELSQNFNPSGYLVFEQILKISLDFSSR
jgi:hypothetical protein